MGTRAVTTVVSVSSAAKVQLLAASTTRRGWIIQNTSNVALRVFFDSDADDALQFSANTLIADPGGFSGRVEAQRASGGAFNIQVTEFL
jgi:hypothetical protein